jgi:hypothetical protein
MWQPRLNGGRNGTNAARAIMNVVSPSGVFLPPTCHISQKKKIFVASAMHWIWLSNTPRDMPEGDFSLAVSHPKTIYTVRANESRPEERKTMMKPNSLPKDADELVALAEGIATMLSGKRDALGFSVDLKSLLQAARRPILSCGFTKSGLMRDSDMAHTL